MEVFGGHATGARLEKLQDSPYFDGERFRNPVDTPQARPSLGLAWEYLTDGGHRVPKEELPIVRPEARSLQAGQGEGLRVTWLGHSTMLVEIDGALILTDPVFGLRASPFGWMGPKRFHAPPIEPEDLPPLDLILVSHDHYDHLDFPTIKRLASRDTPWVTSLGVGAHLERWGVPSERVTELGWWERMEVAGLEITACPCRHFAGRGPSASKATFWSSWAMRGPKHSAWFSGDTGIWEDAWDEIADRFGGFDLSMIEIGAFHEAWSSIHLGPHNALTTHQHIKAKTMMPVHWGTFSLALHDWDEPIATLIEAADHAGVQLLSPIMGQTVHREAGVAKYWSDRAKMRG